MSDKLTNRIDILEHRAEDIKKILIRKISGYETIHVSILIDSNGTKYHVAVRSSESNVDETFSAMLSPIAIANQVTLRWNAIQRP